MFFLSYEQKQIVRKHFLPHIGKKCFYFLYFFTTKSMPHLGHFPGVLATISVSIGQV